MFVTLNRSKKYIIFIIVCFVLLYSLTYASIPIKQGITGIKVLEPKPKTILKASWGKTKGKFGKSDEGSVPGPMSFTVNKNSVYFLDQENQRVQIFNLQGKYQKDFKLKKATYSDIKTDGFYIYLLDAYVTLSVDVYNLQGDLKKTFPVNKKLQPVTGFQVINGKILAEANHTSSTIVGSVRGTFLSRIKTSKVFSGRLANNNRSIKAVFNESASIKVDDEQINLNSPDLRAIVDLLVDQNSVYILLGLKKQENTLTGSYLSLLKITNGKTQWQIFLPDKYATDHFRKIDVYDGSVYQMQTTQKGLELVKWR